MTALLPSPIAGAPKFLRAVGGPLPEQAGGGIDVVAVVGKEPDITALGRACSRAGRQQDNHARQSLGCRFVESDHDTYLLRKRPGDQDSLRLVQRSKRSTEADVPSRKTPTLLIPLPLHFQRDRFLLELGQAMGYRHRRVPVGICFPLLEPSRARRHCAAFGRRAAQPGSSIALMTEVRTKQLTKRGHKRRGSGTGNRVSQDSLGFAGLRPCPVSTILK